MFSLLDEDDSEVSRENDITVDFIEAIIHSTLGTLNRAIVLCVMLMFSRSWSFTPVQMLFVSIAVSFQSRCFMTRVQVLLCGGLSLIRVIPIMFNTFESKNSLRLHSHSHEARNCVNSFTNAYRADVRSVPVKVISRLGVAYHL